MWFDGQGGFPEGWIHGPLVALDPIVRLRWSRRAPDAGPAAVLDELDRLVLERRRRGGPAETGLAVLAGYELTDPAGASPPRLPSLLVLAVDRSVRWTDDGAALVTCVAADDRGSPTGWIERLESTAVPGVPRAARVVGPVETSLPRERYLASVSRLQRHIAAGDIYQANLCQRFAADYEGSALECFAELARDNVAPHSAYLAADGLAVVSISPETFLRMSAVDRLETWPIKGTRPRSADPRADRRAAEELVASEKDRAELVMIVDLERNDLSRVCRAGSVTVEPLAELRSYATVHHLVAGVFGEPEGSTAPSRWIRATFPGGSITGAPKLRAMEILRDVEPVPRELFTGSLFWFGDDGRMDSSILIRSAIFDGRRMLLGAGGGIVADSVPEREWEESNHKARALARILGFEPEEAA